MNKVSLLVVVLCISNLAFAQTYIPGNTYFDSTGYVEYRAGNLPIIISAPHGGSLEPSSIPDRSCSGCVLVKDAFTKPIAEGIYDEMLETTGCYPHVIINLLHRKKFDANRDIGDAADGNPSVEKAWRAYHNFIHSAKDKVTEDYGRGLFLDMHGHGHTIQRIELGYLLKRADLQLPDSALNSISHLEESSIRSLVSDNIETLDHATLLRGLKSLGSILDTKGFSSVPSLSDPYPQGSDPYFEGGYNTRRHGSVDNAGAIDAIQIELNQDIRFNDSTRLILIDSLTQSALEYYDIHYNNEFITRYCKLIPNNIEKQPKTSTLHVYPNPTSSYVMVEGLVKTAAASIFTLEGKVILTQTLTPGHSIDLRVLDQGFYLLRIKEDGGLMYTARLLIK